MIFGLSLLTIAKYAAAICIFIYILLAPAYLAVANKRAKYDCMRVRCGSWLFGWSFFGWLFALFVAAKK